MFNIYTITPKNLPNNAIDVKGSSSMDGTALISWDKGGSHQRWRLLEYTDITERKNWEN